MSAPTVSVTPVNAAPVRAFVNLITQSYCSVSAAGRQLTSALARSFAADATPVTQTSAAPTISISANGVFDISSSTTHAPRLANAVHDPLIKQSARPHDQQRGHEAAEDYHAIARQGADRLHETDVDQHAEQWSERGPEPADQAISEAVHAEHDVKNARFNVGREVRIEPAADAGDRAGKTGSNHLDPRDSDAIEPGQSRILADHPKDHAEAGALE